MIRLFLAALCCVVFSVNAEARQRHKTYLAHPDCNILWPCEGVAPSPRGEMIARQVGFGMAQKIYTPQAADPIQKQRVRTMRRTGHHAVRVQASHPRVRQAAINPQVVAHPEGCPRRLFCGCGAAVRIFGKPVRELWLAANWFRYPRSPPAPGMVAVRRHHVFVLEEDLGRGRWKVYDANSGRGLTRVHARSLAGYVIVNPRGGSG